MHYDSDCINTNGKSSFPFDCIIRKEDDQIYQIS